ncbi:hypothetical protein G7Z17_g11242 [Cylindrodendrum hubeiense]|uniref:Uncharacterized protein n=1 Tax=Cylindrodendrum hubeiense TaxID=595255 RepID=A0A9P5GXX4_9HYPO|nr:hypothetical protein G7Z17_g11242 [Cylindrodendrum hubeiense]
MTSILLPLALSTPKPGAALEAPAVDQPSVARVVLIPNRHGTGLGADRPTRRWKPSEAPSGLAKLQLPRILVPSGRFFLVAHIAASSRALRVCCSTAGVNSPAAPPPAHSPRQASASSRWLFSHGSGFRSGLRKPQPLIP